MNMCVHGMCLIGPEGGVRFLGAGCTESCESPNVGARPGTEFGSSV